jgi:hypothetical protein
MCLGVPGQILDVEESPLRMGRVAFGTTVKEVSLACVPEAMPGGWLWNSWMNPRPNSCSMPWPNWRRAGPRRMHEVRG